MSLMTMKMIMMTLNVFDDGDNDYDGAIDSDDDARIDD